MDPSFSPDGYSFTYILWMQALILPVVVGGALHLRRITILADAVRYSWRWIVLYFAGLLVTGLAAIGLALVWFAFVPTSSLWIATVVCGILAAYALFGWTFTSRPLKVGTMLDTAVLALSLALSVTTLVLLYLIWNDDTVASLLPFGLYCPLPAWQLIACLVRVAELNGALPMNTKPRK